MAACGRIARICLVLSLGVPMSSWFVVMTAANAAAAPVSSPASVAASAGEQIVAYGNGGFEWG
jgi:hypothetical protein